MTVADLQNIYTVIVTDLEIERKFNMIRDSLGVPVEPEEELSVHIGYDWRNQAIYSDDNDEYIEYGDDLILDDPEDIRAYLLEDGVIKDTVQLYEEWKEYV